MAVTGRIDRERALVTARSVLANVDVLETEGLDSTGQATLIELAERLADGVDAPARLNDESAAALARQMRETLSALPGRSSNIFVNWLDDLLDPEGGPNSPATSG